MHIYITKIMSFWENPFPKNPVAFSLKDVFGHIDTPLQI